MLNWKNIKNMISTTDKIYDENYNNLQVIQVADCLMEFNSTLTLDNKESRMTDLCLIDSIGSITCNGGNTLLTQMNDGNWDYRGKQYCF